MEYEFTLKFKRGAESNDMDALIERLGEAGCNDALVGLGAPGCVRLDFTREAESAETAMLTAIANVKRAASDCVLIEAAPDFVGLSDIAETLGMTRQNMRKIMITHAASFPAPLHEGSAAVWHLAEVLRWLIERGSYEIDGSVLEVARTAMQINLVNQSGQIEPRLGREVAALLT